MVDRFSRQLTAEEFSVLRWHGDGLAAGHTDLESVAAVARVYRTRGISWVEIAAALGVTTDDLRIGRDTAASSPKPISTAPALSAGRSPVGPRHPSRVGGRVLLFAAGNTKPGGNDFAAEAAEIRARLTPHGVEVTERFNIELPELRRELDAVRPAVLHLAAHHDFGGLCLSLDAVPCAVLIDDLGQVIRESVSQPTLVVLNCCHSEYRYLVAGQGLGESFTDARLAVTARWPDQALPRLFGNRQVELFPPEGAFPS